MSEKLPEPQNHSEHLQRAMRAMAGDDVPAPQAAPEPVQQEQAAPEPVQQEQASQEPPTQPPAQNDLAQRLVEQDRELVELRQQLKAVNNNGYVSVQDLKAQVQQDPMAALQQLGFDGNSLLDLALSVNAPAQQEQVKDPLEEIRERLENFEKQTKQTLAQQYQTTEMTRIQNHVEANREKYPWVAALANDGSIGQAYEYMVQLYNQKVESALPGQQATIPSYDEFLPKLEETLSSTAKRWNELHSSLQPQRPGQQPPLQPQAQQPQAQSQQIPHGIQETPDRSKMTPEEKYKRALAIAEGRLT